MTPIFCAYQPIFMPLGQRHDPLYSAPDWLLPVALQTCVTVMVFNQHLDTCQVDGSSWQKKVLTDIYFNKFVNNSEMWNESGRNVSIKLSDLMIFMSI